MESKSAMRYLVPQMTVASDALTGLFLTHEDLEPAFEDAELYLTRCEADPDDPMAIAALERSTGDLRRRVDDHMTVEERVVFPAMAGAGAPEPLLAQMLHAHEELRRLAKRAFTDKLDVHAIRAFIVAFEKHAEYEERALAHFWAKAKG